LQAAIIIKPAVIVLILLQDKFLAIYVCCNFPLHEIDVADSVGRGILMTAWL
jgi:hypothetical protein